ncbi:MAG: tetratricopeptide repeat protein, partial [Bacteroidota bacterium]
MHSSPLIFARKVSWLLLLCWSWSLTGQPTLDADSLLAEMVALSPAERLVVLDQVCFDEVVTADTVYAYWLATALSLASPEENTERAKQTTLRLDRNRSYLTAQRLLQPFFADRVNWRDRGKRLQILALEGQLLYETGAFAAAQELLEQTDSLLNLHPETDREFNARFRKTYGQTLMMTGEYGRAIVNLNHSTDLFRELGDSVRIQDNYNEKGNIFGSIGLYDEAIANFQERLRYDLRASDYSLAFIYTNIGRCHLEQREYPEAIDYYQRLLALPAIPQDAIYARLYALNGLAEVYYHLDRPEEVTGYANRLREEFAAQGSAEMDAFLVTQADIFADILGARYTRAEQNLLALYRAAEANGSSPEMIAYARQLTECYRRWGRPERALDFNEIATHLNDSIRAANKTHALVLYQTIHRTEEKVREIERLEAEQQIQQLRATRNRSWFLLLAVSLLAGGGFLFLRQRNRHKIREAVKIERLRNQISADLHDDVGSLLT